MSRPLRIAAQHDAGAGGGRALVRLLAALAALGHAVRVYHDDAGVRDMALGAGLVTRRLPLSGFVGIHRAARLGRDLRARDVDAVLLDPATLWLAGLGARRSPRTRAVVRFRDASELPRGRARSEACRRWVDLVVLDSEALEAAFREAVPGFAGRTAVIRPGVLPPSTRGGLAFRARAGVPLDGFLVGTHGPGLEATGAYETLFRVLAATPAAHGVILTAGPPRSRVEKEAERRGLIRRVHAVDPGPDPGPALDALDLYLRPDAAAPAAEPVLEALAAGVPLLSLPAPGLEEVVDPGGQSAAGDAAPGSVAGDAAAGIVAGGAAPGIIAGDPEEAAAVVRRLIQEPELRRSMAAAAKHVAGSRFDFARAVTEWERLLTEQVGAAAGLGSGGGLPSTGDSTRSAAAGGGGHAG